MSFATAFTLAISLAVVLISEALVLAVFIADMLLATVVTSVAFGTNPVSYTHLRAHET